MSANRNIRIVFMGTPDFAVASLKMLVEAEENIVGVLTAPDRPAGRGQQLRISPVKKYALSKGIPVLQAVKLREPSFLDTLKSLKPDLFIVVAFRMLPEIIWKLPPLGTFNLHASLLPQYRGAAPINWAVMNGEKETGLTTFFIDEEIDTGKIILQEKVIISDSTTAGDLHDNLMNLGADLVLKTVSHIKKGNIILKHQIEHATPGLILKPAPKLFKEQCKIVWTEDRDNIYNFIRGLSPYPGAWTLFINEDIEEFSAKILLAEKHVTTQELPFGTVEQTINNELVVYTGKGAIRILKLQAAGKKIMKTEEFLRGYRKKLLKAK